MPTFLANFCPTGTTETLTWSFVSNPTGGPYTLDANGQVGWTNPAAGTYDITLVGTFSDLRTIKSTFELSVVNACASESLDSVSN